MEYLQNFDRVRDSYDGYLFDAYGVLYDGKGLIPGAIAAWNDLMARGRGCWILTNGSARTLSDTRLMYERLGFRVNEDQIINSASLLAGYFQEKNLRGSRCAVLGTAGSASYVRAAGGEVIDPLKTDDYEVVVIANQTEYPLLDSLESVLSASLTRIEKGLPLHLVLTNPDLIYPHQTRRFGITAGSLALLLEAALKARLGPEAPLFDKLGKPYARIYEEAIGRAGSRQLLMVGDQLETDIRGANGVGIDSLLVGTGLVRVDHWQPRADDPNPTYVLANWG